MKLNRSNKTKLTLSVNDRFLYMNEKYYKNIHVNSHFLHQAIVKKKIKSSFKWIIPK